MKSVSYAKVITLLILMASSALLAAPQLNRETVDAYNRAVRYINSKQYEAALPHLDQVIIMAPDFFDARYARAACLYGARQYEQALVDVQAAEQLKPGDARIRSIRAGIYYETNRLDEALSEFNTILSKQPGQSEALLGRGVVLMKQDRIEEGSKDLRAFLKKRPNDPNAPQIRKVLKSIDQGISEEELYAEEPEQSTAPGEPKKMTRRSSGGKGEMARRTVDTQKLLNELFQKRGQTSEQYQRRVTRGEQATATGSHSMFQEGVSK